MSTQKTIIDSIDVREFSEPQIDVLLTMADVFRARNTETRHVSNSPLSHGILQKPGRALRPATRDVIYGVDD